METSNPHWNDLPNDLLELIVLRLSMWDHTSFGCVCSSWRRTLLRNMPKLQSLLKGSWLIAYENDRNHRCYIHDLMNSRHFTHEFPELDGTLCLASRYGWSLMCSDTSKLFFFNIFSRRQIILPIWKSQELTFRIFSFFARNMGDFRIRHFIAGFSDPSSSDCMVVLIRRINDSKIEISRCIRGEKDWTGRILNIPGKMGKLSGLSVHEDLIHCFDEDSRGNVQTWYFDTTEMSLTASDPYLRLNQSRMPNFVVMTLTIIDLYQSFLMRIPSLESWSLSRSSRYDADKLPHRYVYLYVHLN